MARRSSARLRARNSSTPQPVRRVSLSHDATPQAPKTVPSKLSVLDESDEMPGSFPQSPTATPTQPSKRVKKTEADFESTPNNATPIQPSDQEMHPQKHHQTAAKPREEARWLGFSKMPPATEPSKRTTVGPNTPSKSINPPNFQFTFQREHSLELSPEAKRLMIEVRNDAVKIRDEMVTAGETAPKVFDMLQHRKIASAKGRFSDVHQAATNNMQSIENHPSAWRKNPNRQAVIAAAEKSLADRAAQTSSKSLKRSPSKAQLDSPSTTPSRSTGKTIPKPTQNTPSRHFQTTSNETLRNAQSLQASKRARMGDTPTGAVLTTQARSENGGPSTPRREHLEDSHRSNLVTPTQSSLARANSTKASKTGSKIPGLAMSATKAHHTTENTPLLSRTPAKATSPSKPDAAVEPSSKAPRSILDSSFARTPGKGGVLKNLSREVSDGPSTQISKIDEPLLARSPLKMSVTRSYGDDQGGNDGKLVSQSFLDRSPIKMLLVKDSATISNGVPDKPSSIPLLSRSPAKPTMSNNPFTSSGAESPEKANSTGLMGRFNLLRRSPTKSILRSPQRLYSDDPAKVAAGTHFATPPPKFGIRQSTEHLQAGPVPMTAPVRKHVDFTASTKTRYEKSESEASSSPKRSTSATEQPPTTPTGSPGGIAYPTLPSPDVRLTPSPEKRRQTAGPGDFTFRAGNAISFSTSPRADVSGSARRPPTIRHVSADTRLPPLTEGSKKRKFEFENKTAGASQTETILPSAGSKKRKYEFENDTVSHAAETKRASGGNPTATVLADEEVEDKENTPQTEERPAKRVKSSTVGPVVATKKPDVSARRTTLGVKPKGAKTVPSKGHGANSGSKKPSVITQSRLAALAMPKKRG